MQDALLPVTEQIVQGALRLILNWSTDPNDVQSVEDALKPDAPALLEVSLLWADGEKSSQHLSVLGKAFESALARYVAGEEPVWPDVNIPLHTCSEFTRSVLSALKKVPRGEVLSYKELSSLAGRPNAARGVGQIMARNRWPLIIPCHRVLAANRKIGGFSGQGITMKLELLRMEKVML